MILLALLACLATDTASPEDFAEAWAEARCSLQEECGAEYSEEQYADCVEERVQAGARNWPSSCADSWDDELAAACLEEERNPALCESTAENWESCEALVSLCAG
jgi:hypothetical protein